MVLDELQTLLRGAGLRLGSEMLSRQWRAWRDAGGAGDDVDGFFRHLRDEGLIREAEYLRLAHLGAVEVGGSISEVYIGGSGGDPDFVARGLVPTDDRFEMMGAIGEGAMGQVLLARDEYLRRKVAIKQMSEQVAKREGLARRFVAEVQITAQLDHPNIVPVYNLVAGPDGTVAYTMKLVRGRTLKDLVEGCRQTLKSGKPLAEDEALAARLEHFLKICDAMAYAHSRGIVHRDLKPANIMIGKFNEVYVMDWGIARLIGTEAVPEPRADDSRDSANVEITNLGTETERTAVYQTQLGEALGTPAYMSPEQARGLNAQLDGRSDQYTLGLILQELVTLRRGRNGTRVVAVLMQAQQGEREPVRHLTRKAVPADLVAIIRKATHLLPERRYPDCEALADDVRRYLHGEETHARPDSLLRRLSRRMARHRELALALMLLLVVGAAGTAILSLVAIQVNTIAAQARQDALTEQLDAVSDQAHRIDQVFLRYEGLLEGLGAGATQLLTHGTPDPGQRYYNVDYTPAGTPPPDLAVSPLYKQAVSFDSPVFKLAPGVERADVDDALARLLPIRLQFRRTFLRSHGVETPRKRRAVQEMLLREEGVPLVWAYIGLSAGVHTSYPGHGPYPDTYDPRQRPWYLETVDTVGPRWSTPYPDVNGQGLILPCNLALTDADGAVLGVAGIELTFETVIRTLLTVEGIDGEAWLVNPDGDVVVRSSELGRDYDEGLHGNRAVELKPFPFAEARTAMTSEEAGFRQIEGQLVVWRRLSTLGWTYVITAPQRGWW